MDFSPTSIPAVLLIKPKIFTDDRGFFLETFRTGIFEQAGIGQPFVQDNPSGSSKGVLCGLHMQIRQPQVLLVHRDPHREQRCLEETLSAKSDPFPPLSALPTRW